jgi:DNA ligase-1
VLLYAQSGHGRRAGLYTDFTLGVWDREGKLVPLTKAYSGLTDVEMKKINSFVRKNTLEKFGPVVYVKPHYVFEISCEGIQKSSRHKVGWALRFPRITRIREDKRPEDADRIEQVEAVFNSIY